MTVPDFPDEVLAVDADRLAEDVAYRAALREFARQTTYDRALAITTALQAQYIANGGTLPHPVCFHVGHVPHDRDTKTAA